MYSENEDLTAAKNGSASEKIWKAPPVGFLKLNSDVAVDANRRKANAGMVVRDDKGKFIFAASFPVQYTKKVAQMEGLAMENALKMAMERGLSDLILESDCLPLIQALKKDRFSGSEEELFFYDLKMNITCVVGDRIGFVCRDGNAPAHILAKFGLLSSDSFSWADVWPNFLSPSLCKDLALL